MSINTSGSDSTRNTDQRLTDTDTAGEHLGAAAVITRLAERVLDSAVPVQLVAWDGSRGGPADAPVTVALRSRRAVRRLLWEPSELGVARGYVEGDIDIDIADGLTLDQALADPRVSRAAVAARHASHHRLAVAVAVATAAARLKALGPPPPVPVEESALKGRRHSRQRDAEAVAHHYDVGNAFYRVLLGESMVYSCGYWRSDPQPGYGVDDAQRDKIDLICGKLGLSAGQRLLDVGCGWGSLVIHAAQRYGVEAVGVTLSAEQAAHARERVEQAGLADRVQIRLQDYRQVSDGPFDAIASVGMAEHVGSENFPVYAQQMLQLLRPEGRLLHHQITAPHRTSRCDRKRFIDRYIFPDGELLPVGEVVDRLELAGLEAHDVESLRDHYTLTLRAWLSNLEAGWAQACALTTPARARTWRLYLAGSAAAFATRRISVHQVLASAPRPDGRSALPRLRQDWLPDQPGRADLWFTPSPRAEGRSR